MGLSGEAPLGEIKTKATNSNYRKNEPPAADTAGGGRAAQRGSMSSTATCRAPTSLWSPFKRYNGGRVLVLVT